MAVQLLLSPTNGSQPLITCNRHHPQTLYTRRIFSMDAVDSPLTAAAQPQLQTLMSHKPKPSTANLVLQPPAAQIPLQARRHSSPPPRFLQHMNGTRMQLSIPATRPRCPGSWAHAALVRPSAPRATNHLPPGEGWARRLP